MAKRKKIFIYIHTEIISFFTREIFRADFYMKQIMIPGYLEISECLQPGSKTDSVDLI